MCVGATRSNVCPVEAVLSFMVARGDTPGPLFSEEDGKYLTKVKFVAEVRSAFRKVGYPAERYDTALELGLPQWQGNTVSRTP